MYLHKKLGGLEQILPVDPSSTVLHHFVFNTGLDLRQRLFLQFQTLGMVLPLQHRTKQGLSVSCTQFTNYFKQQHIFTKLTICSV